MLNNILLQIQQIQQVHGYPYIILLFYLTKNNIYIIYKWLVIVVLVVIKDILVETS